MVVLDEIRTSGINILQRRISGAQSGEHPAIYARVSTSDQSCERQLADPTASAEGRSYRWIARDLGISRSIVADIVKRGRKAAP